MDQVKPLDTIRIAIAGLGGDAHGQAGLPQLAGPVIVNRRAEFSIFSAEASSRLRPIKLVISIGIPELCSIFSCILGQYENQDKVTRCRKGRRL